MSNSKTAGVSMELTGHMAVVITQDQFSQLMGVILQVWMDAKFSQFEAEVRQGQENIAVKALKRSRFERPCSYKRK